MYMPITSSAKKAMRQSNKKRLVNKKFKDDLKISLNIFNKKVAKKEALTKEEVTFSESGDYTGSKVYLDNDELYYENKVVEFTKDVRETDLYNKSNKKNATIRSEYENGRPVFVKA